MQRTEALKRNITRNYGFLFLAFMRPSNGVWMIFLAANNFSLLDLGLLEGILHCASFLGEVPTGVIADLKGRLASRKIGRVLYVAATLLVMTAHSFFIVALGFVLYAFSYNLESGAGEALIYDTLAELEETPRFKTIKAQNELMFQSANILGLLLGGWLAIQSYTLLFTLECFTAIIAFYFATLQVEPYFEKSKAPIAAHSIFGKMISSLKSQIQSALITIRTRPVVSLLIIQSAFIIAFTMTLFYYLQIYWKSHGLSEFEIGFIFALTCTAAVLAAFLAPLAERRVGREKLVGILPPLLILCLFMLSFEILMPLAYVLTGTLEGILAVVVQDWINVQIPASERATILSFQSMLYSIIMILLFPLTGFLSTWFGIPIAFLVLTLCACVFSGWFFTRREILRPVPPVHQSY